MKTWLQKQYSILFSKLLCIFPIISCGCMPNSAKRHMIPTVGSHMKNAQFLLRHSYPTRFPLKHMTIHNPRSQFLSNKNHLFAASNGYSMGRYTTTIKNYTTDKSLIDVLDNYGIRTGEVLPKKEIHAQGKIHRAVHLYLFDEKGNILLQKRSRNVDHYPGMWSISLTGHVDAGEGSSQALKREIQEELSLDPKHLDLHFLFSFRQDATLSAQYIDCQFNDVYTCWHQFNLTNLKPTPNEVAAFKLIPFSQFVSMVQHGKEEIVPAYSRACNDLIYFLNHMKKKST